MLDNDHVRRFHDQGFVARRRAFDPEALVPVRDAIDGALRKFDPQRHRSVFSTGDGDRGRDERFFRSAETVEYFLEEDALDAAGRLRAPLAHSVNKIGHALHDHLPAVSAFCRAGAIRQALHALGLSRPRLWQSMVIFKQPGIGGEVRWHQDATYLHTRPPSVVGLWVALEDADEDNGCLLVAPGGHRGPLRERYRVDWGRREGTLQTLDHTPWPEAEDAVPVVLPAGGAVLFHDHLPHASAANRSARSRTALTLHFADAGSEWSEDNWLQRPTLGAFELD